MKINILVLLDFDHKLTKSQFMVLEGITSLYNTPFEFCLSSLALFTNIV